MSYGFPVKIDMLLTLIHRNIFAKLQNLSQVCQLSDEVENPEIWFILEESPSCLAVLLKFDWDPDGIPGVITRSKMVVLIKTMFMNLCKGLNYI